MSNLLITLPSEPIYLQCQLFKGLCSYHLLIYHFLSTIEPILSVVLIFVAAAPVKGRWNLFTVVTSEEDVFK